MAVLNIRNLEDTVHARLRVRAALAGRSMEAEARMILTEAVSKPPRATPPEALQAWVDELFGEDRPSSAVDELLAERRHEAAREL